MAEIAPSVHSQYNCLKCNHLWRSWRNGRCPKCGASGNGEIVVVVMPQPDVLFEEAADVVGTKPKTNRPPWAKDDDKARLKRDRTAIRSFDAPLVRQDGTIENIRNGLSVCEYRNIHGYWALDCDCETFKKVRRNQAPFCEHIQKALMDEWDTKDIKGNRRRIQSDLIVPIFFKPDCHVYVQVMPFEEGGDLGEARMVWGNEFGHKIEGTHTLGTVTSTSGRWAIRELVLEYAVELLIDPEKMTCKAPHHSRGYYEEPTITADGSPRKEALVDMLDLLFNDWCRRCAEDNGVPDI